MDDLGSLQQKYVFLLNLDLELSDNLCIDK